MSERFDTDLRALAERAEQTLHLDPDWQADVRRRAGRGRALRGAAGVGAVAVGLLGIGLAASALGGAPAPVPPATSEPTGTSEPTSEPTGTGEPTSEPTGALSTLTVIAGWRDAGVDPAVFADSVVTDAVAWQGSIVAVGCDQVATATGSTEPQGAPIWVGSGGTWQRSGPVSVPDPAGSATGAPVTCLDQVVATPYGLYAAAGAAVLQSDDGLSWGVVPDLWDAGTGWVDAILASGDRVTVLGSRASLAESSVATLWSTTDGETWSRAGSGPWPREEAGVGDDPAVTFDNGGIADVVEWGDGLVAVGASPGGAFVPTAAAWTSTDTVTWERATVEDADECYLTAVGSTSGGLLGAGWCMSSGQPALWTSSDGTTWQRAVAPVADLPEFSFVDVTDLAVLDTGAIVVAGTLSVGGLEESTPVQWTGTDGQWQIADDLAAPFHAVGGVAIWPATGAGPAAVLLAE